MKSITTALASKSMKAGLRRGRSSFPAPVWLLAALLLVLPSCNRTATRSSDRYAPAIENLELSIRHELEDKRIPSISVALTDDRELIWSGAFGMADPQAKRAADSDTAYRVASVSKLFTDVAVMKLVEEEKLDLDAPVSRYAPEFHPENPFGKEITLRKILSHRSGLVREPPVGNYFDPTEPTLRETVMSLNDTRLVYEPDTKTKYSNAAIGLAGYVVEKTAGEDFADYMQKAVLDPLGMKHSSFRLSDSIRARLARGKMWRYDGKEFDAPVFRFGFSPAANLYATMPDLAAFARMILRKGDGLLRPETLAAMTTPQSNDPRGYGLGFRIDTFEGRRRLSHSGAVYGYATEFEVLPDDGIGVCVSASMDVANTVARRIAEHAMRLVLAARAEEPPPEMETTGPVDPAVARKLDGTYRSGPKTVDLHERGGRLFLETDRMLAELKSFGGGYIVDDRHSYGTKVAPRDDDGIEVDGEVFERTDVPMPEAPPGRWLPLIGEYGWDHNTLYIYEKHGILHALIEWTEIDPLTEVGSDEFAFPDFSMYQGEKIAFRRDGKGNVTGAVVAGIRFDRRAVGTKAGETFTIQPTRSVEELRKEALAAAPPAAQEDLLPSDLVEVARLDPSIKLDIRYATTNNFMQTVFYSQPRAFLQRPAAEALVRVHGKLLRQGFGILIHDAYRPWYVTKMFWDATPERYKIFVADPATGSIHNRGGAVDVTLYDIRTGKPLDMVSGYDEFSDRAFAFYPGGTSRQRWARRLLRRAMEEEGFEVYPWEWWHFNYRDAGRYPVMNTTFDHIKN